MSHERPKPPNPPSIDNLDEVSIEQKRQQFEAVFIPEFQKLAVTRMVADLRGSIAEKRYYGESSAADYMQREIKLIKETAPKAAKLEPAFNFTEGGRVEFFISLVYTDPASQEKYEFAPGQIGRWDFDYKSYSESFWDLFRKLQKRDPEGANDFIKKLFSETAQKTVDKFEKDIKEFKHARTKYESEKTDHNFRFLKDTEYDLRQTENKLKAIRESALHMGIPFGPETVN